MKILAIESSCDETAAALIEDGRTIRSSVINSQVEEHKLYGGVVPEIASRRHAENICAVVEKALSDAGETFSSIDAVAVTYAPGLIGALLVGVNYAKGVALASGKPLIPVHHIRGHIAANYITHKELKPPFICVMMSGGNTQIVHVKDYTKFEVLGKTRDDAIGEAFDKVARVVGLGYPGGPKVDKLAKEGKANIELPKTHFDEDTLDFSFSGIKTAVINLNHKNPNINKADLCASFQKNVTDTLIENVKKAVDKTKIKRIVLAGGVSANSYIREKFLEFEKDGIKVYMPDLKLCTDNAAMIASAGYYNFISGKRDKLDLNAVPNIQLGN